MKREVVICDFCESVGDTTLAEVHVTALKDDEEHDLCADCAVEFLKNQFGVNLHEHLEQKEGLIPRVPDSALPGRFQGIRRQGNE